MTKGSGSTRGIKLCLLGDFNVGKSSLALRFASDRFDPMSTATIGASFLKKTFSFGEDTFEYHIWDTAGQERYKSLVPMYFRDADAAIIVYDLTDDLTFKSVKDCVQRLQQLAPQNIAIAIAGNKSDLLEQKQVETNTALEYAGSIDAVFAEVSALNSTNVNYIFEEISKKLQLKIDGNKETGRKLSIKSPPKSSKCC